MHEPARRTDSALYWSAVSLIVCEGLSIDKAAERLSVDEDHLRTIVHRRQLLRPAEYLDALPAVQ